MKKLIIDGYEVYIENGKMILGAFTDYAGNKHWFKIDEILENDFIERRKKEFAKEYEERTHLDTSVDNEYTLEVRNIFKNKSAEDIFIENNTLEKIVKEIWKLPVPQNRRTYMKLISGFSLTEIARIENRDVSAIKRSVDTGLEKIRKKFKKF